MALTLHGQYQPQEIAASFGEKFGPHWIQTGIVTLKDRKLLFVTLKKGELRPEHQYADQFVGPELFEWQSQNAQSHSTDAGRLYIEHASRGFGIELFVRSTRRTPSGQVRPYYYLGPVRYSESRGDKPMTVRWRLEDPVPEAIRKELLVPEGSSTVPGPIRRALSEDPSSWDREDHPEPDPKAVAALKAAIEADDHSAKEMWVQQKIRVGVRGFRTAVLTNFGGVCAVCGLDEEPLLDAAHVKAWSKEEKERLNPANGLALCVLHHRAYDRGLLSITEDGSIQISALVRRSQNEALKATLGCLSGPIRSSKFPVNLSR